MPIGTSPSKRSHGIVAGNLSLYDLIVKNGCAVVEQKSSEALGNTQKILRVAVASAMIFALTPYDTSSFYTITSK